MALSAFNEVNQVSGVRTYYVDTVSDLPTGSTVHAGDIALDLSYVAGTTSKWVYNGSNWVAVETSPTYNAAVSKIAQIYIAKASFTLAQIKAGAVNKVSTLAVVTLPANAVVLGLRAKNTAANAGGGESVCTLQIGITGTIAAFMTAVDIFVVAADTTIYQTLAAAAVTAAATPVIATITTTTNNVSSLTTGGVDIWINYVILP